jgi:hypothetical protein
MISWEAVTALGTVFTGLVILLTVVVGWRELDQVRRANQLEGVMKIADTLGTERYQKARVFVMTELESKMRDTEFATELATAVANDEKRHPEIVVLMEHELVGVYIKHGLVSGDAIYDLCGSRLISSWKKLQPLVELLRARRNDNAIWENAEWLSLQAEKWLERQEKKAVAR